MERKVSVYNEDGDVVGRVQYNNELDYWDGRNFSSGEMGRHLGITRLSDGRYVLIHGTDWQGERDTAEVVSAARALQAILRAGALELLKKKKFSELQELENKKILGEMD